MKSTAAAFILLFLLFFFSVRISSKQKAVIEPISEKIANIPTSSVQFEYSEKEYYRSLLTECINEFEEKSFTIELGIPNEEQQRFLLSLKNALSSLIADDFSMFFAYINECKTYADSLLDYCQTSVKRVL